MTKKANNKNTPSKKQGNATVVNTIPLVDNTACCIIPPKSVWPQIEAIRSQHDKSYGRWPVHMNLFFPFLPNTHFSSASLDLCKDLAQIAPFHVELSELHYNEDSKYLFLKPKIISSADPHVFGKIVKTIIKRYPQCEKAMTGKLPDQLDFWLPHLTLGQFQKNEIDHYKNAIQQEWIPIQFQVDTISLLSRKGRDDPFKIDVQVKLGSG